MKTYVPETVAKAGARLNLEGDGSTYLAKLLQKGSVFCVTCPNGTAVFHNEGRSIMDYNYTYGEAIKTYERWKKERPILAFVVAETGEVHILQAHYWRDHSEQRLSAMRTTIRLMQQGTMASSPDDRYSLQADIDHYEDQEKRRAAADKTQTKLNLLEEASMPIAEAFKAELTKADPSGTVTAAECYAEDDMVTIQVPFRVAKAFASALSFR